MIYFILSFEGSTSESNSTIIEKEELITEEDGDESEQENEWGECQETYVAGELWVQYNTSRNGTMQLAQQWAQKELRNNYIVWNNGNVNSITIKIMILHEIFQYRPTPWSEHLTVCQKLWRKKLCRKLFWHQTTLEKSQ